MRIVWEEESVREVLVFALGELQQSSLSWFVSLRLLCYCFFYCVTKPKMLEYDEQISKRNKYITIYYHSRTL